MLSHWGEWLGMDVLHVLIAVLHVPELIVGLLISLELSQATLVVDGQHEGRWGGKLVILGVVEAALVIGGSEVGEHELLGVREIDDLVGVGCAVDLEVGGEVPLLEGVLSDEVLNSENLLPLLPVVGQHLWQVLVLGLLGEQVEAVLGLKGGGVGLLVVLGVEGLGVPGAVLDLDVEDDVGVKRDWLSTERGLGVGSPPGVVGWAGDGGLVSLVELGEGEVPALEDLVVSDGEGLGETKSLGPGVSDESSIGESSLPVDDSPVALGALLALAGGGDANSNPAEVVVGAIVLIVLSVGAVDVRGLPDVDGLARREQEGYCVFHFIIIILNFNEIKN